MQANNSKDNIVSIILAAGKGTRMNSPHLHKVCYQIDGKPVIARAIDTYNACGIGVHCIVVGDVLGQVVQAASLAEGAIVFCHQTEQKGTGHAAKCGARLLKSLDYHGAVLVAAGDKIIEETILRKLINVYRRSECDLAMIVSDAAPNSSAGRIVCDTDGKAVGIVEAYDIARLQVLNLLNKLTTDKEILASEAQSLVLAYLKSEKKAALALGDVWTQIKKGQLIGSSMLHDVFSEDDFSLKINGKTILAEALSSSGYLNTSVYLFRADTLYRALDRINSDNAQNEEYLTDTVKVLASERADIQLVPVDYPEQVMAFNTQEEFNNIVNYFSGRKAVSVDDPPKAVRRASEWLQRFESEEIAGRHLHEIYGDDDLLVENKRRLLISMLRSYVSRYADDNVIITRAPGRLNIMGRHIDSQGGHTNLMAIDKDLYLVVGARSDRQVMLHNLNAREMPQRRFDTDDVVASYDGGDWLDFVDSEHIKNRARQARGDWSQYVTAPVARFQTKYPNIPLKGMNIVAAGDIPMAAGLSSSSAVVVAVAEAITHINGIDITPEQFVELCGEGEWYVGTRGGSADHAAMKFAKIGKVIHVGFHPFHLVDEVSFPSEYEFLVCNSQIKAHKTGGARDIFNHRIACYYIARDLFRQSFPSHGSQIEHVRDINTRNLGIAYPELLRMILEIPEVMTREQLMECLSQEQINKYLGTHSEGFREYPLRAVLMFGLSECERSRMCPELLVNKRIDEFGRLMNVSHNGDRVAHWQDGYSSPYTPDYSDAGIRKLIDGADKGDLRASLVYQPGNYGCSVPEIDKMVDIAIGQQCVLGAQMLGAGLGGCMAILVRKENAEEARQALIRGYYEPAGLASEIFKCRPVAGSRVIRF